MKKRDFLKMRQKHYVAGVSTSCLALVGFPELVSVGTVKVGVKVGVGAVVETGGHGVNTDVGLRLVAEVGVGPVVAVVVTDVEVVAEACISGTAISDLAGVLFTMGAGLL